MIDLTDHLQTYLDRNLPRARHRAELRVLDAGVDVHGAAGGGAVRDGVLDRRRSRATPRSRRRRRRGSASIASIAPILLGAVFAAGSISCWRGRPDHEPAAERAAAGRARRRSGTQRYNFAYAGEYGRVYKAYELRRDSRPHATSSRSSERGTGPDYPTYLLTADARAHVRAEDEAVDAAKRERCTSSATRRRASRSASRRCTRPACSPSARSD